MHSSEMKSAITSKEEITKPNIQLNHLPDGIEAKKSTQKLSKPVDDKKECQENLNLKIKIYKNYGINIYKPFIFLKLAQFSWFGAGSFMVAFLTVFLKQRGVSLSQLSWMATISSIVQIAGTALTGVIADKIGNPKPVLIANLLLVLSMIISIILMPTMKEIPNENEKLNLSCQSQTFEHIFHKQNCSIKLKNCSIECSENTHKLFNEQNLSCNIQSMMTNNNSFIFEQFGEKMRSNNSERCSFNTTFLPSEDIIRTWCANSLNSSCQISCNVDSGFNCYVIEGSNWILIGYAVFFVLFLTTYSNVYRCFDVTVMALVKEHHGDFGVERFFAISGNLIVSPIAGLIVSATTKTGGEKNYVAAFYLFIGMVFLVLALLYKIPDAKTSPAEKMGRKTFNLLKNPDVLVLIIIVLVLGMAWNVTRIFVFWYLADLHASSVLIGLIPSISALYGLPFLLTANWWINKVGSTQLMVVALLAYVLKCVGYSFILNTWHSLILEAFGGFTYYLLWVAVVVYCHEIAPEGLRATAVAVAGALHYSVGKATGGLVGGLVMDSYGGRFAFRLIAIICLISALFYSIYLRIRHLCVSKELQLNHSGKMQQMEKEPAVFIIRKMS